MARSPSVVAAASPPRVALVVALVIGVACAGLRLGAQQTALSGYLVGPQDELRITVFDEAGPSGTYLVDGDGSITFPLLGRVSVDGLTLARSRTRSPGSWVTDFSSIPR